MFYSKLKYILQLSKTCFLTNILQDELPRKPDGTVDWDSAGVWWKFWWWIDFFCGTDLLGMKGED